MVHLATRRILYMLCVHYCRKPLLLLVLELHWKWREGGSSLVAPALLLATIAYTYSAADSHALVVQARAKPGGLCLHCGVEVDMSLYRQLLRRWWGSEGSGNELPSPVLQFLYCAVQVGSHMRVHPPALVPPRGRGHPQALKLVPPRRRSQEKQSRKGS